MAGIGAVGTHGECRRRGLMARTAAAGIEAARAAGYDILTGICPFTAIGKAVATGETEGFAKVIVDTATRKFLGVHIIGQSADEILQEAVLAMHASISADKLLDTLHPHPTLAESIREATAAALGRPINL